MEPFSYLGSDPFSGFASDFITTIRGSAAVVVHIASGSGIDYHELFWKNKPIFETETAKRELFSRSGNSLAMLFSAMTESYRESSRQDYREVIRETGSSFVVIDSQW